MDDVLGGRTDPDRFEAFLADWRGNLERRVATAVSTFAPIEGVCGLVLAGGVGRGEPWPLSDIDLLPIYDDDLFKRRGKKSSGCASECLSRGSTRAGGQDSTLVGSRSPRAKLSRRSARTARR